MGMAQSGRDRLKTVWLRLLGPLKKVPTNQAKAKFDECFVVGATLEPNSSMAHQECIRLSSLAARFEAPSMTPDHIKPTEHAANWARVLSD